MNGLEIENNGKTVRVYVNGLVVWQGTIEEWSWAISHPLTPRISA